MDLDKVYSLPRGQYAFGDPSVLLTQKVWELTKRGVRYVVGNKHSFIIPALSVGQTIGIKFEKFEDFVARSGFVAFVPIECLSKKIKIEGLITFSVFDSCQLRYNSDDGFINGITIDGVFHEVI